MVFSDADPLIPWLVDRRIARTPDNPADRERTLGELGALLEGMPELAEYVFEMPVKRGIPSGIGGLRDVVNSPKFATGVGLLQYGARNLGRHLGRNRFTIRDKNIYDKVRGSMRSWIKDLF